nr:immunoglobulin light chain junction region [Macaca mulatta]MOV75268.1 immunoglobulin light chain junction region [Macaca mulatta]MOV76780.1 immunoglobulin light chain junction region [Macaca mulatta]MOW08332.1 immunoglobulin light chain junction region [Macaca mulatta]MOW08477.1 immunoglobulin light chain junction region [Macaca mulatta]
CQHHNSYPWTF